ncbi:unnamed protein product, partial [Polarella glacialis]
MEERERWLLEQPVAVLEAHAQECGIDTAGCRAPQELVRQILIGEPSAFGGWRQVDGSTLRLPGSRHNDDDELLAHRLQAEENSGDWMSRASESRAHFDDDERSGSERRGTDFLEVLGQLARTNPNALGRPSSEGPPSEQRAEGESSVLQQLLELLVNEAQPGEARASGGGGLGAQVGAALTARRWGRRNGLPLGREPDETPSVQGEGGEAAEGAANGELRLRLADADRSSQ